ncbi:hypothetical protein TNCV_192141 [Trichonephila clavipes]|nr:hypothetical protein TNCV_192141 [Trichonephila clavipes]
MTDICHYPHEETEQQLQLKSDTLKLHPPEGWYQDQPFNESFTTVVCMQGDQPFTSHSRHAIRGNVCSEHVNISISTSMEGCVLYG